METPPVLEEQKAAHGHLAAVYDKIQSAASRCGVSQRTSDCELPCLHSFLGVCWVGFRECSVV
jgi:hypothetical protein